MASAKLANKRVMKRIAVIRTLYTKLPCEVSPVATQTQTPAITSVPTQTVNITGFRTIDVGLSLTNDCQKASLTRPVSNNLCFRLCIDIIFCLSNFVIVNCDPDSYRESIVNSPFHYFIPKNS